MEPLWLQNSLLKTFLLYSYLTEQTLILKHNIFVNIININIFTQRFINLMIKLTTIDPIIFRCVWSIINMNEMFICSTYYWRLEITFKLQWELWSIIVFCVGQTKYCFMITLHQKLHVWFVLRSIYDLSIKIDIVQVRRNTKNPIT